MFYHTFCCESELLNTFDYRFDYMHEVTKCIACGERTGPTVSHTLEIKGTFIRIVSFRDCEGQRIR